MAVDLHGNRPALAAAAVGAIDFLLMEQQLAGTSEIKFTAKKQPGVKSDVPH